MPEGLLAAGSPANVLRALSPGEIGTIRQTALDYVAHARAYAPR
ncbi:MAG TPA: hypothetical protein VI932_06265 [Bacteroidota bacterium]|nr:hypothetical protein [Bacteroidota bacterium]